MNVPFRTRSRSFEVVFSMSRWNHQTDPCNQSIQCVLLRHMTMYERVYFDGFRSFSLKILKSQVTVSLWVFLRSRVR